MTTFNFRNKYLTLRLFEQYLLLSKDRKSLTGEYSLYVVIG